MMDTYTYLFMIANVLSLLGQLAISVFCIVLLIKKTSLGSILMAIGSVLGLLFGHIGFYLISFIGNTVDSFDIFNLQGAMSILSGLFYMVFATGFIIHLVHYLWPKRKPETIEDISGRS